MNGHQETSPGAQSSRMGPRAFGALLCGLSLLLCMPQARAEKAQPTWDPAGIEDFTLTEAHGQTVTKADLLGKPWLACFVFTRCAGPCPLVSERMQMLQQKLAGVDIRLVSISVDPTYDTPEVLRDYAKRYKADPERWWFLTGDKETIFRLVKKSFRMIVEDDPLQRPGFEVIHSIEIMHVDEKGVIRGRYNARDDVDMARLRRKLLGKSDATDVKLIEEAEVIERRQEELQKQAEAAHEAELAREALENAPAWVLRLPTVNACLNGLATLLLLAGYAFVKSGRIEAHKTTMLSTFVTSCLFLACYLTYHFALKHYTGSSSRPFEAAGVIRGVYLTILVTHVVLAAAVPVLALITIYRGLTAQWERHKRIARITFPIWLYVSVTGVIIYFMLYHWPRW